MAATAFCPAYATGIFTIGENGAAGAGFSLDKGLSTTVSQPRSEKGKITMNGVGSAAPVSNAVLRRFAKLGCSVKGLCISHSSEVPVGFGLGMSAAGALSLSLALDEFLGAGLHREECVKIAHDAEVECGTGLSGVDAAAIGGFLLQGKIGAKPIRLPLEKRKIHLAFFEPMRTAGVIRSPLWKARVNRAGNEALAALSKKRGFDSFVSCCREFSSKAHLSDWCIPRMERNPRACMAMLGHALFSDQKLSGMGNAAMAMAANAPGGKAGLV